MITFKEFLKEGSEKYHDEHLGTGPGDYVVKVHMSNRLGPFIKKHGVAGANSKDEAVSRVHDHFKKTYGANIDHTDVYRYQPEHDDPKKRGWKPPRF